MTYPDLFAVLLLSLLAQSVVLVSVAYRLCPVARAKIRSALQRIFQAF